MRFPLLATFLLCLAGHLTCSGQIWIDWRNSQPIGTIYGVAVSPESTVAVGYDGRISTRNNQTGVWTIQTLTSPNYYSFRDVVHGDGQFVAVRDSGQIVTSGDGLVWTPRSSGVTSDLNAVIWTGSQYVAAGSGGKILTSPDGMAWTPRDSGATITFRSLAFSGTRYIAVGDQGVRVSNDSIAWSEPVTPPSSIQFKACTWTGNRFIAVGYGPGYIPTIHTSPSGYIWVQQNTTFKDNIDSVASINGTWYIAGALRGTFTGYMKKSTDQGTTWTDIDAAPYFMDLTVHGDFLVAAGPVSDVWALPQSPVEPDTLGISPVSEEEVELKIRTRVGSNYQLEFSPDLLSWTNRGAGIIGDGRVKLVPDSREENAPGFYRLAVSPVVGEGDLVILDARYGRYHLTSDVKPLLIANIRNGVVTMRIDNQTMGGDPYVGISKEVVVRYQTTSGVYEANFPEFRTLRVPDPSHVAVE